MWETWVQSLGWEDPLEKGKATHSSTLAWRIPQTTVHRVTKSWTQLSDFHFFFFAILLCWSPGEILADIKKKNNNKKIQGWRNQQSLLGIFFSTVHLEFDAVISNAVMDAVFDLIAAATAKSLQSCPTLRNPIDSSPPGSPVPGILQARTLEWVAISFSNSGKWKVKVKSLSRVRLLATPWTAAYQAPLSMGFSRQEYLINFT